MLATKLHAAFFLLALTFSNEFAHSVNGGPTRRPSLNVTRPGSTPPLKKSTARSGRFLGKFSILAGVGLPEPTPLPISRNDYLLEQRMPAHFAASYNFPPTRWGPYVAAVYEPLPIATFLQNPLGYLASALNPLNWFVSPENASSTPATAPPERHREDVVVVVREPENELVSDERKTTTTAVDAEEEREQDALSDEKNHDDVKVTTTKSIRKMKLRPTIDLEKIMDLIAEETTMKVVRLGEDLEDESRQAVKPRPTIKVTTRHPAKPTVKTTTTKTSTAKPTTLKTTTVKSSTVEEVTDEPIETTTEEGIPTTTQSSTANATSAAPYPHASYGPPKYVNGYYYGGYPQNVSHIQLTTQAAASSFGHAAPIAFQNFNDANQIPQHLPNNYYDTFDPQAQSSLDYYSHFEQLQPVDNHYQKNEQTFSSNKIGFRPNGFRPSYPVYQ